VSQALVRAAFETALSTWAAAQTPPIPVAWENVNFNPPASRYIRANLLPADTASFDLLGKHRRYQGVLQIMLCMPLGVGKGATEALVSAIEALFPQAAWFTASAFRVQVASPMSAAPSFPDDSKMLTPVSCRYRSDIVVS